MKKLLKLSLLLVTLVAVFTSCAEDDDEYDYVIEFAALPSQARNLVNNHFEGTTVTQVRQKYAPDSDGTVYEIFLTGYEIKCDTNGKWIKIEGKNNKALPVSLFGSEIPMAIKTYVETNHANQNIVEIERKSYGFEVELSNDMDLKFNADGSLYGA